MNTTEHTIMNYAKSHRQFTRDEILAYLSNDGPYEMSALAWHLNVLTKQKKLARVGRGVYSVADKQQFSPAPSDNLISLYKSLTSEFPAEDFCLYASGVFAGLTRHDFHNAITYIETGHAAVEDVFSFMKLTGTPVFINPTPELIFHYVDMTKPAFFVKTMISESPLQTIRGVPGPTLEKLLVDFLTDPDFCSLQGEEYALILTNAFTVYHVNTSRLLRYAARRGVRREMTVLTEKFTNNLPATV